MKANVPKAGEVYNSLTLTGNFSFIMTNSGRRQVVEAVCRCGKVKNYALRQLRSGDTQSCGCVRKEKLLASRVTHNLSKHPLYSVYQDMIRRCYDEKCESFKGYGGRGITVCDEWRESVKNFCDWGMANGYKKGLELDKVNNYGKYEPSNCRFVTRAIGNTNTRRVKEVTAFGETKCIAEWARDKRCSITEKTLADRFSSGRWSIESAITAPGNYRKKEFSRIIGTSRKIKAFGEEKSIIEWSEDERCKVGYSGLKARIGKGWDFEKAISAPHRLKEQI